MSIRENIAKIREQLAPSAKRAGRNLDEIALMAVSKTFPVKAIREAYDSGIRLFGESKVQEFNGKHEAVSDLSGAAWHMIGHLQTNKAAKAVELFSAIDSLDSLKLAEKLNAAAAQFSRPLRILIEINIGGEDAKTGLAPDSAELESILQAASRLTNLQFAGLMTVPPYFDDPEKARPFFRRLRDLQKTIARRHLPSLTLETLSMGMSHDFEVAIEEGSTCVRIGTAIFGERDYSQKG